MISILKKLLHVLNFAGRSIPIGSVTFIFVFVQSSLKQLYIGSHIGLSPLSAVITHVLVRFTTVTIYQIICIKFCYKNGLKCSMFLEVLNAASGGFTSIISGSQMNEQNLKMTDTLEARRRQ